MIFAPVPTLAQYVSVDTHTSPPLSASTVYSILVQAVHIVIASNASLAIHSTELMAHYVILYRKSATSNCYPCNIISPQCQACNSAGQCTSCSAGFVIDHATCIFYLILDNYACVFCSSAIPNCASCLDGPTCSACAPGYELISSTSCQQCTSLHGANCLSCDATRCLSCPPGFTFDDSQCNYNLI